jgi:hypothetical protein
MIDDFCSDVIFERFALTISRKTFQKILPVNFEIAFFGAHQKALFFRFEVCCMPAPDIFVLILKFSPHLPDLSMKFRT